MSRKLGSGRAWQMAIVTTLAMAYLLGACASSASVADKPTATTTPVPTITPAPTETPISDPLAVCTSAPGAGVHVVSTRVGALDGGWQALPSNLDLKPQPGDLSINNQQNAMLALKGVTLWVNVGVLNPGDNGNICAVTVKIISYQPLATPIPNVTRICSDAVWLNPGGLETGGDCGAIGGAGGRADLVFTSAAAGTSVSVALHDLNNPQADQPVQVPANGGTQASIMAHIQVPASGTYTVSVGIWQDRSGPAVFTTLQATFDVDAQHEWSGRACSTPAMQAQMPSPTNPPSTFICPGDPPTQE